MMASPMMNATTGFAWRAGTLAGESASFVISFVNSATAAVKVDVVSIGFRNRKRGDLISNLEIVRRGCGKVTS